MLPKDSSPGYKINLTACKEKVKGYLRNAIQKVILKTDEFLEWVKLATDRNINCLEHHLFLLSMRIDGRLDN
ncbi:MAG: hypothetical protein M3247_06275 [Thermoproteota archaeon]|nr:hypothetical protein [Thermoproteota archaeon]